MADRRIGVARTPAISGTQRVLSQRARHRDRLYPNVRGSWGFGKAFGRLDDGMKREDSVKDIGALLDWIETQPTLEQEIA